MSIKNEGTGEQDTGHVWDGDLRDLTNEPPKWWMLGLTASGVWVIVYWLLYPSIPISFGFADHWKGLLHWSAISELHQDQAELDSVRKKYEDKIKSLSPAAIVADRELSEYVTRSGKVLFGDNCAGCHGQNGVGIADKDGLLAPILNDDDWLYGGNIDKIQESILGGRQAMMIAHGGTLPEQQIEQLANWVKASSEGKGDAPEVAAGKAAFQTAGCIACHGADGKGMQAMGSANLTDKVWRFASSLDAIKYTITHGVNYPADPKTRVAVMPNFKEAGKLSDTEIKKLAVYVYKFGGGVPDAPAPVAPPVESPAVAPAVTPAAAATPNTSAKP
jgi:cytochrome c oxidase cbb3-type subunit 3